MNNLEKPFPLISIITTVYNGEKYIESTILSIINQSYKNIEYIIIDGGSKDGTLDIIKKYQDKIAYWKSEPDNGIYDAFNKGIKIAKGQLIGIIGADDWLEKDAIIKIAKCYKDFTVIYGDVRYWDQGTKGRKTNSNHIRMREGMTVAHPTVFVPKSIYEKYGLFNQQFMIAGDYDFVLRLFVNKISFYKINEVLVNMRKGGISDKRWLKAIYEEKKIKDKYFNSYANYFYFLRQFSIFFLKSILKKD